ncbi:hypothetical protein K6025_04980 [Ehrlichia sp. JZT12]
MFAVILEEFIKNLDEEIHRCTLENLNYDPNIVKCTCNISTLMECVSEFKLLCCSYNIQDFKDEIVLIEQSAENAHDFAVVSEMFVGLKGREEVNHDPCELAIDGPVRLFCKRNLNRVSNTVRKVCGVLFNHPYSVRKCNILEMGEKICLIVQNCLKNIDDIEKMESFATYTVSNVNVKSCTHNANDCGNSGGAYCPF